ncbi:alpha/beta fold hydrolase [Methanolobus halotolerans]|uniref:Alpha/beta hydrolase n=1 Tax=Methanolobus halotolerans TaxID=2052935 RepID=A0A4E0Q549_9EURY|nr:alpha/beta hydrolase [Methanolobus halotolerans]TGC09165.1 alpha/beta hydrolase [Methanolobus halotolerans]
MGEEKKFSAESYYKSEIADWIVFVHGFGGSARTWKKQIEFFAKHYNLLVLEMHKEKNNENLNLDKVCGFINNTLNQHNIEKAHFLSSSFSSLICLRLAVLYPERVNSLIMSGGIIKFNFKTRFLLSLAVVSKRWVNYMILYRFFAYIILPKKNHARSRSIFIKEAKKLGYAEFCKWVDIIPQTEKSLTWLDGINDEIKILYVSGKQDYLFLKNTLKYSKKMPNSQIEIIENCGHVCSIEQYDRFNSIVFKYLNQTA